MSDDQNQDTSAKEGAKTITTTVTCPHCGKEHEAKVEIPESSEATKMAWQN